MLLLNVIVIYTLFLAGACKQKLTIYTNHRYNLTVNVVQFSLLLYDPNIICFAAIC
jgi:hypothetical protein